MIDDTELLRRYVHERSEAAFGELVRRHVDLVYSAALRQTYGNHHRAQDVTQMVFIDLARKAEGLMRHTALLAWLHKSTYLAALSTLRRDSRRSLYERAAACESALSGAPESVAVWEQARPVIDEALAGLAESDRQAILLRFFSNQTFIEVGSRLNVTENAARMRVDRALDKLRALLARRGITSSNAALAAMLTTQAVQAAPAGVAAAAQLAVSTAAAGTGLWITLMSTSKLPLSVAAAALVGGTAIVGAQAWSVSQQSKEFDHLSRANQAIPGLLRQNRDLAGAQRQVLADADASLSILRRQVNDMQDALRDKASRPTPRMLGAAQQSSVVDPASLSRMPQPSFMARPEYPSDLRQLGSEGQAQIDFVVGTDGLVYNAQVLSATQKEYGDAALAAVSQWTFTPGQVGGRNVYTHMVVPIVFTLGPGTYTGPTASTIF